MDISIVIPVHNEAENISTLLDDIQNVMSKLGGKCEIIVVDDASCDDTFGVLVGLKDKIPDLRLLSHKFNYGQSAAIHSGADAAKGKIIVTLDGDGQNDPNDIIKLISILKDKRNRNLQMVVGERKNRKDNLWRRTMSKFANSVRSSLLRDDTPDTGCGIKAFYREAVLSLPRFDHMHRFLPALIQRQGGRVLSVEVNHFSRKYGQSHYGTFDRLSAGILDILGVAWLQRRKKIALVEKHEYAQ